MTAVQKDAKKEQALPDYYEDFLKRKTADSEKVLWEAEKSLFAYADYQKAVSDWNAYVADTMAYAELFPKIAEALSMFAGFALYHEQEAEKYASQLMNARNTLTQVFRQSAGSVEHGRFTLPRITDSKDFEKAEEFHLSELHTPELTGEELEILVRARNRSVSKARQEELREIIRRFRQEQKGNLLWLREKKTHFRKQEDYLKRKLADREKHFIMKQAVQDVWPMVTEIVRTEDWRIGIEQGKKLLRLWENTPKNRLCLLPYEEKELPEEIRMEFKKAGNYQLLYPGLYWRDVQEGRTVYGRIFPGWYR
ncbi:MAG: hypothetical protein Q4F41_01475 [Eubacteriales bacterium]|nr:hypothetical protein [Eubacteriales bacterium]